MTVTAHRLQLHRRERAAPNGFGGELALVEFARMGYQSQRQ